MESDFSKEELDNKKQIIKNALAYAPLFITIETLNEYFDRTLRLSLKIDISDKEYFGIICELNETLEKIKDKEYIKQNKQLYINKFNEYKEKNKLPNGS